MSADIADRRQLTDIDGWCALAHGRLSFMLVCTDRRVKCDCHPEFPYRANAPCAAEYSSACSISVLSF
jgi:hypothetical protein